MNISRKKLIENAGIFKEGSTDRDAIAHFVWGRDDLMDKSEDELEGLINDLEKEYNTSKSNYPSVDEYLEDLEAYGAYRDYLKEGPVSEGVDPNFPVKLTITVKASDLIEKFGGEDGIGNAALDAQEFNRFVKVCQDDLVNWFQGPEGDDWVNNGVEQGLYDQFL